MTVDSGACDSIAPPLMFRNTPIKEHNVDVRMQHVGGKRSPTSGYVQ